MKQTDEPRRKTLAISTSTYTKLLHVRDAIAQKLGMRPTIAGTIGYLVTEFERKFKG